MPTDADATKPLIEKMVQVAHEIADSLLKGQCGPADMEKKTSALRNLQAAIKDGLGAQDTADPSLEVARLLALEVEERQIELAERKARLSANQDNENQ